MAFLKFFLQLLGICGINHVYYAKTIAKQIVFVKGYNLDYGFFGDKTLG